MQNLNLFNSIITMSSLEISELTGKRHTHVLVDIENIIKYYENKYSTEKSAQLIYMSSYKDSSGKTNKCYILTKDATLDLVTGYSLEMRHTINKRWQELEQEKLYGNFNLPKTYKEAVANLLETLEQKEMLEKQVEFLGPFKEKVDNSKVIFSKKESVYDEEKGFKKNVKDVYPFLSNAHISLILEHYTTKRYKDTDHYIKSELDCVSTFFTEADMKVSTTKDTVTVKHPCLLTNTMRIRKDKAIEYLDYTEEDFE